MEGARPRLEPGREPYDVETVGRWYRSGDVRGSLHDLLLLVRVLFFRVTVALREGELPITV